MTIDVLYVSYAHDIEWIQWSLVHLRKNLTGHRNVVVVCPTQDRWLFSQIEGIDVLHSIDDWPGRGYFWQQWVKLEAWKYTDADVVVHIDSDVMITAPLKITSLIDKGRPVWPFQSYITLGSFVPWQTPTKTALGPGVSVDNEFMRAFPFVIHRATHELACKHLIEVHGQSVEHYLRNTPAFSEFNVMGCLAHQFQHDLYSWSQLEPNFAPKLTSMVNQHWSHGSSEEFALEHREIGQIPMLTALGVWVVSPDTHLSMWIREHKRLDFDIHFLERIAQYIKAGDVVVDVGAFVGDHSLCYAHMTSKTPGRVLAFEPNPCAFYSLQKNMSPFSHVDCYNVALSDKPGKCALSVDPNAGGMYLDAESTGTPVELKTLDSYKLDRVALIKIDAEGFEPAILRGAVETLKRCKPVLVIEVNEGALQRQKSRSEDLMELLAQLNYSVGHGEIGLQYDIFCFPL
jgi:FkbM family methyltransferase